MVDTFLNIHMPQLNASIVLYNSPRDEVIRAIKSLQRITSIQRIFIIDNSGDHSKDYQDLEITYISNKENLGYGKAHNIALRQSLANKKDYHLVLNSDVEFNAGDVDKMVDYMLEHPKVGLMMPKVLYPDGSLQYLCKLLPAPRDLIERRFCPKAWGKHRQYQFEMRASNYDHVMNVPYLSGCFMLLNVEALSTVGLFDERFFLYPEDIDLTRRLHEEYLTLFYPEVAVIHHHQRGSYKHFDLLCVHMLNMIRYFNKWGWKDQKRLLINKQAQKESMVQKTHQPPTL